MTSRFRLALIQMEVKGGQMDWNIRHATELIAEAASNGASMVLLPECMDLGWTDPSSATMAEAVPGGKAYRALVDSACEHSVYVCAGLTEYAGDEVFNTAIIIDRHGELLCKHRKLNELCLAHEYYSQGDRLNVVQTEYGTIGLMICADGFAKDSVLTRSLGYMGADLILSPSSWAVDGDHNNHEDPYGQLWRNAYTPVAKEFSMPIFGVSNVGAITGGPWRDRKCIGCSLGIGANGEELLQGPYGIDAECILYVEVEIAARPARGTGWQQHWNR